MSELYPQMNEPEATRELLTEQGYNTPDPDIDSPLPVGEGKWDIPHFYTFSQLVNLVSRTYRYTFDEAIKTTQNNYLAIRRDPVIYDAIRARQMPTAQLEWHLEAIDDTDPAQEAAVLGLTEIINNIPRFQQLKMHLLEALFYGRYGVQVIYAWDYSKGEKRLVVRDHRPVNGDKMVFRYGGDVGVLVHAVYPGQWKQTDRGRAHFLSPSEREQLILHKFEPEDADFFDGEMGGRIHGVGLRDRLFWWWWLKAQVMASMMDYLERVGAGGFTIYYYESGNKKSLAEVKTAAETQYRNNTILFPRYKDKSTGGPGVERIEPTLAGAQFLMNLVEQYFDGVSRTLVLGQSLSSTTGSSGTGMGSGVAEAHERTLSRIIKYDAVALQETIRTDLVRVICRYTYPGVPCPKFVFDVDKPNAEETLSAAKDFFEMGGTVDADELRGILGLSKPEQGHAVLSKLPPTSPAGVGALPTGVPVEGQPGPMPANVPPSPTESGHVF